MTQEAAELPPKVCYFSQNRERWEVVLIKRSKAWGRMKIEVKDPVGPETKKDVTYMGQSCRHKNPAG